MKHQSLMQVRWRRFRSIRRARFGLWFLFLSLIVVLFCPLIANDKPLLIRAHIDGQTKLYFPFFKNYKNGDFASGAADDAEFPADYKHLNLGPDALMIWPLIHWGSNESNHVVETYPGAPSEMNFLGTDDRGRDLLTRLLYGFRVSFLFGIATLIAAIIVSTIIGGVQGYLGGRVDMVGQRFVEVWSALPYLYVLILIVNIYEPSVGMLIVANAMFAWITLSYYTRAEVLRTRKAVYVEAVKALGGTHRRILVHHVLPNSLTPILTFAPFILNLAINNLAVLDYLGLGVQPPTASLGELLRQGKTHFTTSWWLAVYPFVVLVVTTVAFNFIGEGLREAFSAHALEKTEVA